MVDFRNYINPQPENGKFSRDWQKSHMPDGEDYVENKSGKQIDALIRSVRDGTIIRVRRLFCLSPWFERPRRRRRILAERVDAIRERGGIILEAETQLRTDVRGHCAKMLMGAYEDIATAGRATSRGKTGRPPVEWTAAQVLVMESLWRSRAYKNDNERLTAIQGKLGRSPSKSALRIRFGSPNDPPKEVLAAEVEKAKRPKAAKVYFIQNSDAVKIGVSCKPQGRLSSMATGNHAELKLLAVLSGGMRRERALHKKFHKHHIRGEWFNLAPEILDYIRQNRQKAK